MDALLKLTDQLNVTYDKYKTRSFHIIDRWLTHTYFSIINAKNIAIISVHRGRVNKMYYSCFGLFAFRFFGIFSGSFF